MHDGLNNHVSRARGIFTSIPLPGTGVSCGWLIYVSPSRNYDGVTSSPRLSRVSREISVWSIRYSLHGQTKERTDDRLVSVNFASEGSRCLIDLQLVSLNRRWLPRVGDWIVFIFISTRYLDLSISCGFGLIVVNSCSIMLQDWLLKTYDIDIDVGWTCYLNIV